MVAEAQDLGAWTGTTCGLVVPALGPESGEIARLLEAREDDHLAGECVTLSLLDEPEGVARPREERLHHQPTAARRRAPIDGALLASGPHLQKEASPRGALLPLRQIFDLDRIARQSSLPVSQVDLEERGFMSERAERQVSLDANPPERQVAEHPAHEQ